MPAEPVFCTACLSPVENPPEETFREPVFGRDFGIFRCPHCGVIFSVIPRDFPLRQWYAKADHLYGEAAWVVHTPPETDWRFKSFFAAARRLGLRGDLLDLGSGDGRFLMRASQEAWPGTLTGLEFNPDMVRRRQGYKVEIAPLEEFVERPGLKPYDVVTIFDVLEHLAEPARSLRRIVGLIKPGGHLIITVPNHERIRLFEREFFDFPPNHNTCWNGSNLADFVRRQGLNVLEVKVSPFSSRGLSDQLFYKLFAGALPLVKRLLFGRKAQSGETLARLLQEEASSPGGGANGLKSALADPVRRRKIELALSHAFNFAVFPLLLPVYMAVRLFLPRRQGGGLFLVARQDVNRP